MGIPCIPCNYHKPEPIVPFPPYNSNDGYIPPQVNQIIVNLPPSSLGGLFGGSGGNVGGILSGFGQLFSPQWPDNLVATFLPADWLSDNFEVSQEDWWGSEEWSNEWSSEESSNESSDESFDKSSDESSDGSSDESSDEGYDSG